MSAPVIDERVHYTAVAAAIDAQLGPDSLTGKSRVYQFGKVPGLDGNAGSIPTIFVLLSVQRRTVPSAKSSRRADTSGWRISARYVARTVNDAALAALRVSDALDGVRLTLGAFTSTPVHHESTQATKPDDGRMSGQSVWTYAI